jgi:hypothetical protein
MGGRESVDRHLRVPGEGRLAERRAAFVVRSAGRAAVCAPFSGLIGTARRLCRHSAHPREFSHTASNPLF